MRNYGVCGGFEGVKGLGSFGVREMGLEVAKG